MNHLRDFWRLYLAAAILLAVAALAGCASAPAIICPDAVTPDRLPECTANLQGCIAVNLEGQRALVCDGEEWREVME